MALSRWQTAAAITFIATVALLLAPSASLARDRDEAVAYATVTAVQGDVFVLRIDGGSGPASEGDVVAVGDAIQTAAGATVELTYVEGSSVRTGEGTTFVVPAMAMESDDGAVLRTWQAITRMVSGGTRYDVRLHTATASVRG